MKVDEAAQIRRAKIKTVKQVLTDLFRQHGDCYFGLDLIAKESEIPEAELWNDDTHEGILRDLQDMGFAHDCGWPRVWCGDPAEMQFD